MNKRFRLGVAMAASLAALPLFAAPPTTPINTTAAVAQLGEIGIAVAAVGGALMVAAAIAVAIKWAKASIFG